MRRVRHIAVLVVGAAVLAAPAAQAAGLRVGAGSSLDLGSGRLRLGCQDLEIAGTLRAGSDGLVAEDLTILPGGSLDAESASLEISGDFVAGPGFVAGTSEVLLGDGCGRTSALVSGSSSFAALSITSASGKRWDFAAGSTQTITSALTIGGVSGTRLVIRSSVGGSEAFLDSQGSESIAFVDVMDNHAVGNAFTTGPGSLDAGNTGGWTFSWLASGRFQYTDRLYDITAYTGTTVRAVRLADVQVYDLGSQLVLGSAATDQNGDFVIQVDDDLLRNVGVRVLASSSQTADLGLSVVDDINADAVYLYHDAGSDQLGHGSADVDFGSMTMPLATGPIASTDWSSQVFNMFDMGVLIADWVASVDGVRPTLAFSLGWNPYNGRSGSSYLDASNRVAVADDDGYDDPNLLHELGHFVDDEFSHSTSPSGTHFVGDNDQDLRLAWAEGLTTFFANVSLELGARPRPDLYVDRDSFDVGGGGGFGYSVEAGGGLGMSGGGAANELVVGAALWDIVDDAGSDDATPGVDDDAMSDPHANIWSVLSQLQIAAPETVSAEDFWDLWFDLALGSAAGMGGVFSGLSIDFAPDAQEPNDRPEDATLLSVGAAWLENTFYRSGGVAGGDEDWFRFSASAGGYYEIEVNGADGAIFGRPDPELFLFDSALSLIVYNEAQRDVVLNSQSSSTAQDMKETVPRVLWRAPQTGDYTLLLRHASYERNVGARHGTYQLRVRNVSAPTPGIASVSLQQMRAGESYQALVLGAEFAVGALVTTQDPGIAVADVRWLAPGALMVRLDVAPSGVADGSYWVRVTNPGDGFQQLPGALVVSSAAAPPVVISELELGSDRVEVRNLGTTTATLTGWQIRSFRPGSSTQTFVFPSFSLAAGATVVVSEVAGVDTASELFDQGALFNWPWAPGVGGAVSLLDASGRNVDFIRFVDSPVDDHQAPQGSGGGWMHPDVQSPPVDRSIARAEASSLQRTRHGLSWAKLSMPLGAAGRDNLTDAWEDNDTPRRAQLFEATGAIPDLAISDRSVGIDIDWFGFPLAAGDAVAFDALFSHGAGDLDMQLYAPGQESLPLLASASASDDEQILLSSALTSANGGGVYRLRVYGYQGALNQYALASKKSVCGDSVLDFSEACDDGNVAGGDCCSSLCAFEALSSVCDDGDACTDGDACDGAGLCVAGAPLACDDLNACTDDGCDSGSGCTVTPNSAPCDDADACTDGDLCAGGVCTGGPPLVCDDLDICTDDGCDTLTGCTATPNSAPCDDADACTDGDVCAGGICSSGPPRVCDDLDVCTDDGCNSGSGCTVTPNVAPCNDGDACTDADVCAGGVCTGGAPPDCDDLDACTADACDQFAGCTHDPIPDCPPAVPAGSGWSRLALVLTLLAAGALWRRRPRRLA